VWSPIRNEYCPRIADTATSRISCNGIFYTLWTANRAIQIVGRLSNCSEHVGMINRLAEIDDMVTRVDRLMVPKTDDAIAEYTAFTDHRLTVFDPWGEPVRL
jgi:hypothetical protein